MNKTYTKTASVVTLLAISFLFLSLHLKTANAINTPAIGVTYTYDVLSTNGKVEWYASGSEGNQTIYENGTIIFKLENKSAGDNNYSALTTNVWYGNISFTFLNSTSDQEVNFTRDQISSNEVSSNLILNIFGWDPGFIAPTNDWAENAQIIETVNNDAGSYGGNLQITNGNELFSVKFDSATQASNFIYDKTSGVLLYANTSFLGFNLEIILEGFSPDDLVGVIPGFPVGVLLFFTGIGLLVIFLKKKRK